MNQDGSTWLLKVAVPPLAIPAFEEALAAEDAALSSFEIPGTALWSVEALTERAPDRALVEERLRTAAAAMDMPIPELLIEELEGRDWVAQSLYGLTPVRAGRFFVHGAHDRNARPAGAIALEVEASAAFGTGHHETTRGCLLMLNGLARQRRYRRPLDLGCGTGVLAMAAAILWRVPVLASDIDPTAVGVARATVEHNRLNHRVDCVVADGLCHPAMRRARPYDLVMANILARPLMRLAPDITRAAPAATLVLAGILRHQALPVATRYRQLGWRINRRLDLGAWTIMTLERATRGDKGV